MVLNGTSFIKKIFNLINRMEMLDVKKLWCQAKIAGTVVTVAGAMLMTIYKGPIVELFWTKHMHQQHTTDTTPSSNSNDSKDFLKGSILLIFATLAWASSSFYRYVHIDILL